MLGIDDGPFDKGSGRPVPIVGVLTEGADLVEAVAVTEFPQDGDGVTDFLAHWIAGLRFASTLHAVVLGGITIAGLGVVEIEGLAAALHTPVIVVNRNRPENATLVEALRAAGLLARIALVEGTSPAWRSATGLHVAHAGAAPEAIERILAACRNKSLLPEPLRLAHLIAAAIGRGQSRGRP